MKYRLLFNERYKPAQYLITHNQEIVWASESLSVWVGQRIEKFLDWVASKDIGTWTVVSSECQPPRVTRTTVTKTMME